MGDFEEKSENDFSDKIAYVFVGSTGCGKSSTINLFSGNKKAIVSNEANSCTTEIEAYEHSNDNNIILIDTVGAEDSRKVKDEEIMKNILVELCLKKIKKVYIIWCIRPCDRATSTLQKQAEFINTFKNTEIWKSVIILVKESKLSKEEDDTRGVIECAAKNGYDKENVKIPCLLYSCVDWLSEKQKKEFDDNEYTEKQKQNLGLLTSNEVKLKIEKSLQQLSGPTQIIFQIKKCINCNGIGDERCMPYIKCHNQKENFHPLKEEIVHNKLLINYHVQESKYVHHGKYILNKYHPNKEHELYHCGKIYSTYQHDGNIERYHHSSYQIIHTGQWINMKTYHPIDQFEKYHNGKVDTRSCHTGREIRYHSQSWDSHSGRRTLVGIFTLGISEMVARGDYPCCKSEDINSQGCCAKYSCCSQSLGSSGCSIKSFFDCCGRNENDGGCKDRYQCCKNMPGHEGCKKDYKWSCCYSNDYNIIGCVQKYYCCNKLIPLNGGSPIDDTKNGCKQIHQCCSKDVGTQGCKESKLYDCCGEDQNNKGCTYRYICCKAPTSAQGCSDKKLWSCCDQSDENSQGCVKKFLCCDQIIPKDKKDSDIKGCKEKYECCNGLPKSIGCCYKCCNENIKHDGCQQRCQQCKQLWGSQNGCSDDGKHELEDIE